MEEGYCDFCGRRRKLTDKYLCRECDKEEGKYINKDILSEMDRNHTRFYYNPKFFERHPNLSRNDQRTWSKRKGWS